MYWLKIAMRGYSRVLVEDFENGMRDLASRDSRHTMSCASTSPVVDKAAILLGNSLQE